MGVQWHGYTLLSNRTVLPGASEYFKKGPRVEEKENPPFPSVLGGMSPPPPSLVSAALPRVGEFSQLPYAAHLGWAGNWAPLGKP